MRWNWSRIFMGSFQLGMAITKKPSSSWFLTEISAWMCSIQSKWPNNIVQIESILKMLNRQSLKMARKNIYLLFGPLLPFRPENLFWLTSIMQMCGNATHENFKRHKSNGFELFDWVYDVLFAYDFIVNFVHKYKCGNGGREWAAENYSNKCFEMHSLQPHRKIMPRI